MVYCPPSSLGALGPMVGTQLCLFPSLTASRCGRLSPGQCPEQAGGAGEQMANGASHSFVLARPWDVR